MHQPPPLRYPPATSIALPADCIRRGAPYERVRDVWTDRRLGVDASDPDTPSSKVDDEQDAVSDQAKHGQDLDREEVRRGDGSPFLARYVRVRRAEIYN